MAPSTEKIEFPGALGASLSARLDLPARPADRVRALRALLHLFEGHARGSLCRRGARRARHRDAALRLHRPRRERRATSPTRISPPTSRTSSPPPTSCAAAMRAPEILVGHSLGGAAVLAAARAHSGGARGRDDRRALRAGARARAHPASRRDRARRRGGGRPRAAGRSASASSSSTISPDSGLRGDRREPRQGAARHALAARRRGRRSTTRRAIFQAARHPKSFVSLDPLTIC